MPRIHWVAEERKTHIAFLKGAKVSRPSQSWIAEGKHRMPPKQEGGKKKEESKKDPRKESSVSPSVSPTRESKKEVVKKKEESKKDPRKEPSVSPTRGLKQGGARRRSPTRIPRRIRQFRLQESMPPRKMTPICARQPTGRWH